jgi:hypothetical protein
MKKTIILSALLVAPTLTFAGGYGAMTLPSTGAASTMAPMTMAETPMNFGSSEDPANAIEARAVTGSPNDNYLRFNYGFIPQSYWEEITGMDLDNSNGFVELEEYLGETRRETFQNPGEDLSREDERQERAKNKALRLRGVMGY